MSGLGIAGDLAIQSVKVNDLGTTTVDDKYGTWAAKVDLDYKINPVTLMLGWAYGSGNNNAIGGH